MPAVLGGADAVCGMPSKRTPIPENKAAGREACDNQKHRESI